MSFIENLGMQLGGQVLGAGLGMALEGHNDNRQLEQNQKLLDQQRKSNEKMTDYSYGKQLEMWKNTSYGAQREQMEKAGINPALMYGMGGGGGVTTGSGTASVGAAEAPKGGGEALGMMQQSAMTQAQMELIKAQTENVKADTANKPIQGANIAGNTAKMGSEKTLIDIEAKIKGDATQDIIQTIRMGMLKINEEQQKLARENQIGAELMETNIKTAQAQLIKIGLENELLKTNKGVGEARIKEIAASISQRWTELSIQERNAITNRRNADTNAKNADTNAKNASTAVTSAGAAERNAAVNADRLAWDKLMRDIPDSERTVVDRILGALGTK